MRDRAVHMVRHMGRADAMMDEIEDGPIWPVHRHEGATGPGPTIMVEVRHIDVGVLEPSVKHQPSIGDQKWTPVHRGNGGPAELRAPDPEASKRGDDANVRLEDLFLVLAREQVLLAMVEGLVRPHVACLPVGGATRGPEQQVRRPSESQAHNHSDDGNRCSEPNCFANALPRPWLRTHLGHVRLAFGQMICLCMMHCMRSLPRVVRCQHDRMKDVTDRGLQPLLIAKGVMATLMRNDPSTGGKRTLHCGIQDPPWPSRSIERNKPPCQVSRSRQLKNRRCRIHERLPGLLLEAIFRDRRHDLSPGGVLHIGLQRLPLHAATVQCFLESFADSLLIQVLLLPTQILRSRKHRSPRQQGGRPSCPPLPPAPPNASHTHRHSRTCRCGRAGMACQPREACAGRRTMLLESRRPARVDKRLPQRDATSRETPRGHSERNRHWCRLSTRRALSLIKPDATTTL
mmetsp:Transcript_71087/g.184580  ORF Transcript_71087/g.184580 Transcript_71087/m.184580 type:complete len:459 (+) Transcript_71087:716-2092(+)